MAIKSVIRDSSQLQWPNRKPVFFFTVVVNLTLYRVHDNWGVLIQIEIYVVLHDAKTIITELVLFVCSTAENRGHILLCWYCCPLVHELPLWCYS